MFVSTYIFFADLNYWNCLLALQFYFDDKHDDIGKCATIREKKWYSAQHKSELNPL